MAENADGPEGEVPEDIAKLRMKAKNGDKAQSDLAQLQKEMAFMRAGVDTTKGPGKLAFEKFDGEPTAEEANAFTTKVAEEYGMTLLTEETPTKEPEEEEPEVDSTVQQLRETQAAMREDLAGGSVIDPGEQPDPDPRIVGITEALKAKAQGATDLDASQEYFGRVFEAAAAGDKRVIYDEGL